MRALLLAAVLVFMAPAEPDGITSVVQVAAPPAGCNEFTETTWDNLNSFTQDTDNEFSADATNDELDFAGASATHWIFHDTTTTDSDQCVAARLNADIGNLDTAGLLLRGSTTATNDVYHANEWSGDNDWYVSRLTVNANTISWDCDTHGPITTLPSIDANDSIAFCVTNTGASTTFQIWHWDEVALPGNCRSDWPTSTSGSRTYWTGTTCGACCVDASQTLTGIGQGGSTATGSWDDFAGSDPD